MSSDARVVLAALVIGGTILVGMGWNITPITTVAALAAVVVALGAPAVGLATIAFMGSLQPPLVIPAPGFNAILVSATVLGCIYRLPIDRPRIRLTPPILLAIAFVLYVAVQQTPEMVAGYAGDLGYLVYSNFRELITELGAVIAAVFVLNRRNPLPFIGVGLVSATLAALLAMVTFGNPGVGPPIAGLLAHTIIGDRAVGSFGNPNYFGTFEAIATVTAVSWMILTRSPRLRLVLLVASIVLGASLAVSLSRGGIIACAAGLACLAISQSRTRTAWVIVIGLILAAVVLFPIFVEWRISTTDGSASASSYAILAESDQERLAAVLAGPQLFLTAPVFGVGWGHYTAMSAQVIGPGVALGAHNWYTSVLAEGGIVGIVIWMLLLGTVVIALRSRPTFARSMGFAVLGAYAVGSLFLEAPTSFQTSVLAILVIVGAIAGDWSGQLGAGRDPATEVDRQARSEAHWKPKAQPNPPPITRP